MRRHLGAVGATLTALGLTLGSPGLIASAAAPPTSAATAALSYLYSQVATDGSVAAAFGPGATEDTVISAADLGYDPATLRNAASGRTTYSYLAGQVAGIDTAGGAAKYVLAWIAAGRPAAIDAGRLLARLNTPTAAGGYLGSNGAFHNADPLVETANAYSQSLAVLADLAARHPLPLHATGWLRCAQRVDGGFGYAITDTAPAPPALCGDTSSDTNDTAIVLQALGQAGVTSATSAATGYLHSAQHADGGFGFNAGSGSDPNSDGTVIQGLVAVGQDPAGAAWTLGGGNALTSLASFADPHGSGGFMAAGATSPDAFTTSSIPQALVRSPYGSATTVVAGSSPPLRTPAPSSPPATPTGSVAAVSVPATGSAVGSGGAATWALILLASGSIALLCGALRRPRSEVP